jgi:hypothetical protein
MENGNWSFENLAAHLPDAEDASPAPCRAPTIEAGAWAGLVEDMHSAYEVLLLCKNATQTQGGMKAVLAGLSTAGMDTDEGSQRERKFRLRVAQHISQNKSDGGGSFSAHAVVSAWRYSASFDLHKCRCSAPHSASGAAPCTCNRAGLITLPNLNKDGDALDQKAAVKKYHVYVHNLKGRYNVSALVTPPPLFLPRPNITNASYAYLHPPTERKKGQRGHGRRRIPAVRFRGN